MEPDLGTVLHQVALDRLEGKFTVANEIMEATDKDITTEERLHQMRQKVLDEVRPDSPERGILLTDTLQVSLTCPRAE